MRNGLCPGRLWQQPCPHQVRPQRWHQPDRLLCLARPHRARAPRLPTREVFPIRPHTPPSPSIHSYPKLKSHINDESLARGPESFPIDLAISAGS
jgi:hypothetical protein